MNFTPSGFMVKGGKSTTTFSTPSQVTVSFAQLNPGTLTFYTWATLRAGVGTVVVPLKETDTPAACALGTNIDGKGDVWVGNIKNRSVVLLAVTIPKATPQVSRPAT